MLYPAAIRHTLAGDNRILFSVFSVTYKAEKKSRFTGELVRDSMVSANNLHYKYHCKTESM